MEQKLEIILALLKFKESHVRGIAKIINQPHANISRALNTLLKENIVDFKIQGKNKTFFLKKNTKTLNYIYIAEHYKLLKLIKKHSHLSVLFDSILSKTRTKLIILFGSYAKSSAKKESDIDIYIKTNKKTTQEKIEDINSKISVKIGKFDKNNLLIKEIIKDHVILRGVEYFYEKNKIFN